MYGYEKHKKARKTDDMIKYEVYKMDNKQISFLSAYELYK